MAINIITINSLNKKRTNSLILKFMSGVVCGQQLYVDWMFFYRIPIIDA